MVSKKHGCFGCFFFQLAATPPGLRFLKLLVPIVKHLFFFLGGGGGAILVFPKIGFFFPPNHPF